MWESSCAHAPAVSVFTVYGECADRQTVLVTLQHFKVQYTTIIPQNKKVTWYSAEGFYLIFLWRMREPNEIIFGQRDFAQIFVAETRTFAESRGDTVPEKLPKQPRGILCRLCVADWARVPAIFCWQPNLAATRIYCRVSAVCLRYNGVDFFGFLTTLLHPHLYTIIWYEYDDMSVSDIRYRTQDRSVDHACGLAWGWWSGSDDRCRLCKKGDMNTHGVKAPNLSEAAMYVHHGGWTQKVGW